MSTNQERDERDDFDVLNYYVENTYANRKTIVCAPLSHAAAEIGIPKVRVRNAIRRWNKWWSAQGVEQSLSYRSGVGYFYTEDAEYRRTVITHQVSVGDGVIRSAKTEAEQASQFDLIVLRKVLSRVAQGEEDTAQLLAVVREALAV